MHLFKNWNNSGIGATSRKHGVGSGEDPVHVHSVPVFQFKTARVKKKGKRSIASSENIALFTSRTRSWPILWNAEIVQL